MASESIPRIEAANLFSVKGLNVVITGGGSGLGAMMTRALAINGANKVFILGRREGSLNDTVNSIPDGSKVIIPVVGDVTSKESLLAAVEVVKSHVPHIDILIANSGYGGDAVRLRDEQHKPLPIGEVAENIMNQDFDDSVNVFRINVVGMQFTCGAFLPLLDAANKARPTTPTIENFKPRPQIIVTGSIGGFSRYTFAGWNYGPSKAAAIHLSKMMATALVPYDIRVNALAPGLYHSEMTDGFFKSMAQGSGNVEGSFDKRIIPATRAGDEEDMAGCVLWLCSRAGAYINGTVIVTDGGRLSTMPATY